MPKKRHRDLVHRSKHNPLITIEDLAFRCPDIHNAGATKHNGEYILLVTIQNALDAVFLVAMVETGQRLLDGPHTLLAVTIYTVAAVIVQVLIVLAYQLLPEAKRQANLDKFNGLLERRGEQLAGWLALALGTLLLVFSIGGELAAR